MKNLYSIADIVSIAIDKYHMNDSETLRKTYYQYFRRTMKKINRKKSYYVLYRTANA